MKWDALQLILVVRIYKSYYLLNREKQGGLLIVVFQNTGMNPDLFISTEGALRLPTTYDNQSHPTQSRPSTKPL